MRLPALIIAVAPILCAQTPVIGPGGSPVVDGSGSGSATLCANVPGQAQCVLLYGASGYANYGTATSGNSPGTSLALATGNGANFQVGQDVVVNFGLSNGNPLHTFVSNISGDTLTLASATTGTVPQSAAIYTTGATQTSGSTTAGSTSVCVTNTFSYASGQGIFIAGAGTSSADYIGKVNGTPSGGCIPITPATGTTVAASTTVQHDETAAIQACVNSFSGTSGGTCYFPNGYYRVNGPLTETSTANCRVCMPQDTLGASLTTITNPIEISLLGQNVSRGGNSWGSSSYASLPGTGVVIDSQETGSGTNPSVIGGAPTTGGTFPYISITLKIANILFRDSESGNVPSQAMVNASEIFIAQLTSMLCDTGIEIDNLPTQASGTGTCAIMPQLDNWTENVMDDVLAQGFHTGFSISEHVQAKTINSFANYCGLQIDNMFHLSHISRYLDQHNTIGICSASTGTTTADVEISQWDTEPALYTGMPSWLTRTADCYDPNNTLRGIAHWGGLAPSGEFHPNNLLLYGCRGFQVTSLNDGVNLSAVQWDYLTDGATITWALNSVASRVAWVQLNGSRTLALTGVPVFGQYTLYVRQGSAGSYTLTMPAGCPSVTLSTTAYVTDRLDFTFGPQECEVRASLAVGSASDVTDPLFEPTEDTSLWTTGTLYQSSADGGTTMAQGVADSLGNPTGLAVSLHANCTAPCYNGYLSSSTYNLTGKAAVVRLRQIGTALNKGGAAFCIGPSATNYICVFEWMITATSAQVFAYYGISGTATQIGSNVNGTGALLDGFAPLNNMWLRIRESGGTVFVDYAPEVVGAPGTWVNIGSISDSTFTPGITSIKVNLSGGLNTTFSTPGKVEFTNFSLY